MSDGDELTKQVDQVYKNLLEKFNPAARNLITAGKAYLKALHGAMSASKVYLEALTRVARHSQQGTWGGSSDVGMCLMQMVDVYKEMQTQQMNILKAFYVDLLVPLETNLDKDTKVLQAEQKKFLSGHKQRQEAYLKASSQLKKHKKKNRANKGAMDREIKQYQAVEEERLKLEGFVESSLQNAVTQERRRYGFILERQCSLAKHYLAHHTRGTTLLQHAHHTWADVASSRETLPNRLLAMLPSQKPRDDEIYSTPLCLEDDAMSVTSQVRKARSVDASCLDLSEINENPGRPLTRARSEQHIEQHRFTPDPNLIRRSMAVPEDTGRRALARALYPYLPSGDNQLSFNELDLIALIGEKNKGWQYGENLRSQMCGWFPVAYTELLQEEDDSALGFHSLQHPPPRSSVGDPSCYGPSSLPPSIESRGGHQGSEASVTPSHHPPRGHHKHRSASAGVVQFRASSPPAASHARAPPATAPIPIPDEPRACPAPPAPQFQPQAVVAPSPSLDTLLSSTSASTTSANTVLYNHNLSHHIPNHYSHHHYPNPPRVPAPTLKKSPSLHAHTHPIHKNNPNTPSTSSTAIGLTRSYTTVASSSTTSTSSSSSTSRFHKKTGNVSFHSSDDSGFSNESGGGTGTPLRPPPNPEVDYDDTSSGLRTTTTNTITTTTATTTTTTTSTTTTTPTTVTSTTTTTTSPPSTPPTSKTTASSTSIPIPTSTSIPSTSSSPALSSSSSSTNRKGRGHR